MSARDRALTRDPDELIDVITRRVMEELSRRDAPSAPSSSARAPATPDARAAAASHSTGDAQALDLATAERLRLFSVSGVRGPEETRALHQAGAARVVATMGYCPASDGLASLIDHTLLKPDATRENIEQLCREAAQFCFASVCVNPNWVPLCRELLARLRRQSVHGDRVPVRIAPARRQGLRGAARGRDRAPRKSTW